MDPTRLFPFACSRYACLTPSGGAHQTLVQGDGRLSLQVVGRINKGWEVLADLSRAAVDAQDAPHLPITVAACGSTDAQGNHETLEEAADRRSRLEETPQQAATRLQAEAAATKHAVQ